MDTSTQIRKQILVFHRFRCVLFDELINWWNGFVDAPEKMSSVTVFTWMDLEVQKNGSLSRQIIIIDASVPTSGSLKLNQT